MKARSSPGGRTGFHRDDVESLKRKGKNLEKAALSHAVLDYVDYRIIELPEQDHRFSKTANRARHQDYLKRFFNWRVCRDHSRGPSAAFYLLHYAISATRTISGCT